MRLLNLLVDAIAHLVHPDKPREFFEHIVLPTDRSPEEIAARLDDLAVKSDAKNWRTSVVDLMKLVGMNSSFDNRRTLAEDLTFEGDYTGAADQNTWLHGQVMKAIEQRGIKLPAG